MSSSLPDILAPNLDALIVAINPSLTSAEAGHSFSSKGNPFWRLLYESGLTSELLRPEDETRLPEFGLGLVSGVQRATRAAVELSASEQARGAERVRQVVTELKPRYVALLGLTLYPVFFPRGTERGPGLTASTIAEAPVFVLPNPSGRNRAYPGFERKLVWFHALAQTVGRGTATRTTFAEHHAPNGALGPNDPSGQSAPPRFAPTSRHRDPKK